MFIFIAINDHNVVYERFKEFSANWEEIAMRLRIKRTSINIIKANLGSSMERMSQILVIWLRRETEDQPRPTWRRLCDAFAGIDRVNAEIIAKEHGCSLNNKDIYVKKQALSTPMSCCICFVEKTKRNHYNMFSFAVFIITICLQKEVVFW